MSADEWQYGVEYEVDSNSSVYTAARSEKQARKWVAESPTDTGLRRRRKAGPWEPYEQFTCGLHISCAKCSFTVCANPGHDTYCGDGTDPHEAMAEHRAKHHEQTPEAVRDAS